MANSRRLKQCRTQLPRATVYEDFTGAKIADAAIGENRQFLGLSLREVHGIFTMVLTIYLRQLNNKKNNFS